MIGLQVGADGSDAQHARLRKAVADTATLSRVVAVLDALDAGDEAHRSRDFGRGVAHAVRLVRAAAEGEAK